MGWRLLAVMPRAVRRLYDALDAAPAPAATSGSAGGDACPNPVPCGNPDVCRFTCGPEAAPTPCVETASCEVGDHTYSWPCNLADG